MKKTVFYLLLVCVAFASCSSGNDTKINSEKESYQLTKEELLKKEQRSPQLFLDIKGHNQKNIIGQTVVKGSIHNKAS
ncbi:MAG: hypothetical protein ABI288_01065, partial [Ginsengibacter sp.]